ncbi:hypothetical protein [Luteimicrobium subarcticum]|uniref:Uncharacterized protein n=1 Tax=Luteimicrobium subarcticum TaxID=620910 RepID=A0A2M8WT74_9MICO|nr:hypothetical protein [Luteimicrobium subarcticum]PJI94157.1 hypothetical protein CLV34_1644 [Luteimicrobium subarcticum]
MNARPDVQLDALAAQKSAAQRARRRRTTAVGATGVAACALVAAAVVGVAQAAPWGSSPVVPTATDGGASTRTVGSTPVPTRTVAAPAPTATTPVPGDAAGDVVTATYDDGFEPYPYHVASDRQWEGWSYTTATDDRFYTCGAPESVLTGAVGDTLALTRGLGPVEVTGEGVTSQETGYTFRVSDPALGTLQVAGPDVVLVQGGVVVGFLQDGHGPQTYDGTSTASGSVALGYLDSMPNRCLAASWEKSADGLEQWDVRTDAPRQAAGEYRAYLVSELSCRDDVTCGEGADTPRTVVSEPFTVTVGGGGKTTLSLAR